jgi:hypothetical protein
LGSQVGMATEVFIAKVDGTPMVPPELSTPCNSV